MAWLLFSIYIYSLLKLDPVHESLFVNSHSSGPPASPICSLALLFIFLWGRSICSSERGRAPAGKLQPLARRSAACRWRGPRNRTWSQWRRWNGRCGRERRMSRWMDGICSFLLLHLMTQTQKQSTHSPWSATKEAESSSATSLCKISVFSSQSCTHFTTLSSLIQDLPKRK